MGNDFVGLVHPCKIYNILTVGTSTLYIGPTESHVTEIAGENEAHQFFLSEHCNNRTLVANILKAFETRGSRTWKKNEKTSHAFGKAALLPRLVHAIELIEVEAETASETVAHDSV